MPREGVERPREVAQEGLCVVLEVVRNVVADDARPQLLGACERCPGVGPGRVRSTHAEDLL